MSDSPDFSSGNEDPNRQNNPQNPSAPTGQPFELYNQSNPYGHARTLVKIAAIVNIIMGSLDILYALFLVLIGVMIATGSIPPDIDFNLPERPAPTTAAAGDPSNGVIAAIVIGVAVFAGVAGILKIVAGIKLLRGRRGSWGFGLAAGIVGCAQLWCSYFCVLPMAVGIFTIIVMCLQTVRNYLRDRAAGLKAGENLGPAPV